MINGSVSSRLCRNWMNVREHILSKLRNARWIEYVIEYESGVHASESSIWMPLNAFNHFNEAENPFRLAAIVRNMNKFPDVNVRVKSSNASNRQAACNQKPFIRSALTRLFSMGNSESRFCQDFSWRKFPREDFPNFNEIMMKTSSKERETSRNQQLPCDGFKK